MVDDLDGITINGIPLKSALEKSEVVGDRQVREIIDGFKKIAIKRQTQKAKFKDSAEKSSRCITRKEPITMEEFSAISDQLKPLVEQEASRRELVISALCSGVALSPADLAKILTMAGRDTNVAAVHAAIHAVRKSKMSKMVKTITPKSGPRHYQLHKWVADNVDPEDLVRLSNLRDPFSITDLDRKNPGLLVEIRKSAEEETGKASVNMDEVEEQFPGKEGESKKSAVEKLFEDLFKDIPNVNVNVNVKVTISLE